jgi:hypothetical protein
MATAREFLSRLIGDNDIWFNEVNARLGGCTHLHHLASVLLGPHWHDHHALVARLDLPATTFTSLHHTLTRHGLAYDPATRAGVVITADNTALGQCAEYAVLAPDHEHALTFEDQLRHVIGPINVLRQRVSWPRSPLHQAGSAEPVRPVPGGRHEREERRGGAWCQRCGRAARWVIRLVIRSRSPRRSRTGNGRGPGRTAACRGGRCWG